LNSKCYIGKTLETNVVGVQVNSAPGEFGTCCDPTVYYSGKMQNVLYSVKMLNSLGAELTRIDVVIPRHQQVFDNVSVKKVRYLGMIANQPSWSGSFGLVVTLPSFSTGSPDSVPAEGMCGVTLSFV
jgi:hypothetical protein